MGKFQDGDGFAATAGKRAEAQVCKSSISLDNRRVLGTLAGMAKRAWIERGFEDFVDGTFGNSGQNLYVSRAGVLQRIHHFDVNADGYVDLLFVNS